jgi:hypothetical protein
VALFVCAFAGDSKHCGVGESMPILLKMPRMLDYRCVPLIVFRVQSPDVLSWCSERLHSFFLVALRSCFPFCRGGYSMLGLGDIVMPGLLLSYAARHDYDSRMSLKWGYGGLKLGFVGVV